MSEAEKQAIIAGGNLKYLWIGATHMLTGYDHLMFAFGIMFLNINSFNAGIELGQISALAAMLALVALWRKAQSFSAHSRLANYSLIMAGLLFFLVQTHGYSHSSQSEDVTAAADSTSRIVAAEAVAATSPEKKLNRPQGKTQLP